MTSTTLTPRCQIILGSFNDTVEFESVMSMTPMSLNNGVLESCKDGQKSYYTVSLKGLEWHPPA